MALTQVDRLIILTRLMIRLVEDVDIRSSQYMTPDPSENNTTDPSFIALFNYDTLPVGRLKDHHLAKRA